MECVYSDPKTFDNSTPTSSIEYWQFHHASCTLNPVPTATPSAISIASTSGYIDIASDSAIANGIHNALTVNYIVLGFVLAYIAWRFGSWLFE